ncbi:hypothetical protein TorRG33x02_067040 [Trema orientale]|uniref:Uncharacterized protein n=1 Tax=Trema orientale TaxID=63057 RepID=A0A2P5FI87_TREOI|nr:hypothetical protein TorRG33x02_067040 [Trema orientale]
MYINLRSKNPKVKLDPNIKPETQSYIRARNFQVRPNPKVWIWTEFGRLIYTPGGKFCPSRNFSSHRSHFQAPPSLPSLSLFWPAFRTSELCCRRGSSSSPCEIVKDRFWLDEELEIELELGLSTTLGFTSNLEKLVVDRFSSPEVFKAVSKASDLASETGAHGDAMRFGYCRDPLWRQGWFECVRLAG